MEVCHYLKYYRTCYTKQRDYFYTMLALAVNATDHLGTGSKQKRMSSFPSGYPKMAEKMKGQNEEYTGFIVLF